MHTAHSLWASKKITYFLTSCLSPKKQDFLPTQHIECSEMKENDKWPFYDHFQPFFDNYMTIFHKTEVQTVILRCLTGLSLIDSKVLIQNANISISIFLQFCTKTQICIFWVFGFCVITFVPIKI